jgi:hypothetical protein
MGMLGTMAVILWLLYGRRSFIYNIARMILINRLSEFLGKISFSMYLIHVPLLALMYSYWVKKTDALVFYDFIYWIPAILVVPAGYVFYMFVERTSLMLLAGYKAKYSLRNN